MAGGNGESSNSGTAPGGAGGAGYSGTAGTAGKGVGSGGVFAAGAGGGGGAAGGGAGGAGGSSGGKNGTTPGYAGGRGGTAAHLNGYAGTSDSPGGNAAQGGGGGGGGFNAFIAYALANKAVTTLTGGNGGAGGMIGGAGGAIGGAGGGGGGGAGGFGAVVTGAAASTNAGRLDGGTGGAGGSAAQGGGKGGPGSGGGDGGTGAVFSATGASFTNDAAIAGGHGGAGGYENTQILEGAGGNGGAGGAGVVFIGPGFTLTNSAGTNSAGTNSAGNTSQGSISGANGGQGGNDGGGGSGKDGVGGAGGIGVSGSGGTITNFGTIEGGVGATGGNGGYGQSGNGGAGGAGIQGSNLTIVNSGTITGGNGGTKGSGVAGLAGDAIHLAGGTNAIALGSAASFTGAIDIQAGTLSFDQSVGTGLPTNVSLTDTVIGAGVVEKSGDGTLTLSGANTYSGGTEIAGGTLDLDAATTTNGSGAITSAAAGTGAITFTTPAFGTTETLKIDQAAQGTDAHHTFANRISGLDQASETIDLAGVGLARTATYNAGAGTVIVSNDGGVTVATLNVGTNAAPPPGEGYLATTDGVGGTVVSLAPYQTSFTVSNATQLNQAISDIDLGGLDSGRGSFTINFAQGFTSGATDGAANALTQQLYAINLASGDALTIAGNNQVLDGGGTYNGLFVYNGTVNISNLNIADAVAQGGAGGQHAGGGAGLGGGLFVAGTGNVDGLGKALVTGGNVTLTNVNFTGDAAKGGAAVGHYGGGGLDGGNGGYFGGGGVGLGANGNYAPRGGGETPSGPGIILGAASGGMGDGGGIKSSSGSDGGGGGGYGGGGGVGGANLTGAYDGPGDYDGNRGRIGYGHGGFGGGGGGFGYGYGGSGGFGGGGSSNLNGRGYGYGGFGGGSGGGGSGGFGGGGKHFEGGSGGLGAGADVFVQQGGVLTISGSGNLATGTVTGGYGPFSGVNGAGFGTSLFLQGNQTVTLAPGAGQTLTIAGTIADETGSDPALTPGQGSGIGAGELAIGPGTTNLTAANTYTGGTTISGGTLDLSGADTLKNGAVLSGAAGTGAISFAGSGDQPATLMVETTAQPGASGTFGTMLDNFGANDGLDLKGFAYSALDTATVTGNLLTFTDNPTGKTESFMLGGTHDAAYFVHDAGANGVLINDALVCFATGTRIRVVRDGREANVAVEDLVVGDLAVTASGAHRPIRWIGRRTIDCRHHPHPDAARPVRIAAHAIGPNRPARDLFVSPGHAICLDASTEVLIPAGALLNGTTIQKVAAERVTYWHVELETHDILLAENLPAESYLEIGNRDFFQGSEVTSLTANPDARIDSATCTDADFCRPFHATGPVVEAVRSRLRARAVAAGWTLDANDNFAGLHLVVDGVRIDPVRRDLVARFIVPRDARDIWLESATSRPCEVADSPDDRALGVCILGLTIADGFTPPFAIDLADPMLRIGFYDLEHGDRRWTADRARLPAALWTRLDGAAVDGFFLRVELACPAVPRWIAPNRITPNLIAPVDAPSLVG